MFLLCEHDVYATTGTIYHCSHLGIYRRIPESVVIFSLQGDRGIRGGYGLPGTKGTKGMKGDMGEEGMKGDMGRKGNRGRFGKQRVRVSSAQHSSSEQLSFVSMYCCYMYQISNS